MKVRSRSRRRRKIWGRLLIFIVAAGAVIGLDGMLRPIVREVSASQTQIAVHRIIQQAVLEVLEEGDLRYQSFVTLQQNVRGETTALTTNTVQINRLQAQLLEKILDSLQANREMRVTLPLGTLLGSLMLRALPPAGRPVAGAAARQDGGQPACEAARTMLLIGCWVVLFTVLSAYLYWAALLLAPGASPHALAFAHALLEMAGGSLALSELAGPWTLPLISFAITFGGLSITLQSLTLLRPCGVPGGRYAAGKALQGALAALICALMERGGAVEALARTGVMPLSEPAGQLAPALAALALGAVALALNRRYIAYENADDAARAAWQKK